MSLEKNFKKKILIRQYEKVEKQGGRYKKMLEIVSQMREGGNSKGRQTDNVRQFSLLSCLSHNVEVIKHFFFNFH